MNKISENEAIRIVYDYIKSPFTNGAIFINGEWGSGKTYFVNNKLKGLIEKEDIDEKDKKEIVYVSLYGFTSCDEVLKQIFIQTAPILKSMNGKSIRKGSVFVKIYWALV